MNRKNDKTLTMYLLETKSLTEVGYIGSIWFEISEITSRVGTAWKNLDLHITNSYIMTANI